VAEERLGRRSVLSVLPRANGFYPLLLAIAEWGDRWCNGDLPPPELRVHECGALLRGYYRCKTCGAPVTGVRVRAL
jgi:hypothetical protein